MILLLSRKQKEGCKYKLDRTYSLYVHTNNINGKKYVGITKRNENDRWLNGKGYANIEFGNAIEKYGWNNFTHDIVLTGLSREEARSMEKLYINKWNTNNKACGYNRTKYNTYNKNELECINNRLLNNNTEIEVERKKKQTITLRLDDDLHKKLKMYSVDREITIQDLLVKLVTDAVTADNKEAKSRIRD